MLSPNPLADRFSQQPPDHSVQQTRSSCKCKHSSTTPQFDITLQSVWYNTPIENNPLVWLSAANALSGDMWKSPLFRKIWKGSNQTVCIRIKELNALHARILWLFLPIVSNAAISFPIFAYACSCFFSHKIGHRCKVRSWVQFVYKGFHCALCNLGSCLTWSVLPTNQRQARFTYQWAITENHYAL